MTCLEWDVKTLLSSWQQWHHTVNSLVGNLPSVVGMSWWVVVVASVMLIAGRWLQWRPLPSSWRATRRRSQSTARFVARSFRATCSNCQRCWVSMTCQLTATMMTAQPRTASPPHCPNCRRSASSISLCILVVGWLSSRVVSMLDSGTEGLGFKSQSRCWWVTVLGKLFTPTVPLFSKQQNW